MIESETPIVEDKSRPMDKAVATALTYNLGYTLRGLLLLPRVEDEVDQRDDRKYEPTPAADNGTSSVILQAQMMGAKSLEELVKMARSVGKIDPSERAPLQELYTKRREELLGSQ